MTKDEFFDELIKNSGNGFTLHFLNTYFSDNNMVDSLNYIVRLPAFFTNGLNIKTTKESFYKWTDKNLSGKFCCLSSDGEYKEYWGFENETDAIKFKLTWR